VDEFTFANVDTNVAEGSAHRVEKNQIAGLQV
jgi:hypothetical protein